MAELLVDRPTSVEQIVALQFGWPLVAGDLVEQAFEMLYVPEGF